MCEETRDLKDCIEDAKESLAENLDGQENYLRRHGVDEIINDSIHECADGAVPVYNSDLLNVFGSDSSLWYAEPDTGFDGNNGIIGAISRVIYDAISSALYEYADDLDGDDLVCEATDCDDEDDHDESSDNDVACKAHCGGPDECESCEEEAEEATRSLNADVTAAEEEAKHQSRPDDVT